MVFMSAMALAAGVAAAKTPAVLATVDGVPIRRTEAEERTWKRYGPGVLQEMIDEVLIRQAAKALGVKADAKEVEARLQRIQGQFPDQATFGARLAASGTSLAELRAQLSEQVLREGLVSKAKGLQVADGELKEFFEANKDKLARSEAVRLRHLVVASEKEARDFLIAIRAGADFGKLASQVSLDNGTKDRGGDVGFISRGMLFPELEKAAFALKPGEVGGPVKTQLGYHLLKVEEVRSAKAAVFAEIRDELRASLLADKVSRSWPVYLDELRAQAKVVTGAGK